MKPSEIRGARARLGYTQKDMADKLGCSPQSYSKKEAGTVKFTDDEKILVCKILELSPSQMNDYFFDGQLPIGSCSCPLGNIIHENEVKENGT